MGEIGCGSSCITFSVSYVTGTFTYPQTEFWEHTGHQERGACLSFHTEVKKQNKTQLLVYTLGILEFANAKMCWLDFPGVRKGTVSSETIVKRGLGLGLEKGYRINRRGALGMSQGAREGGGTNANCIWKCHSGIHDF